MSASQWVQLDATASNPVALQNTALAACLSAFGVPYWPQQTWHKRDDSNFVTWNMAPNSAVHPDLETREVLKGWYNGDFRLKKDALLTGWRLHLALGMMTLEARSLIIENHKKGTPLHLVLCPGQFTRLIAASEKTAPYDLMALAKKTPEQGTAVDHRKLVYAAQIFGFPILRRTETGAFVLPIVSHTFPELRLEMLLRAAQDIRAYNEAQCAGQAQNPPYCNLPGYPPGFHPFQQVLQILHNYEQNMGIIRDHTPITAFLQNKRNKMKSALIRVDSPDDELHLAIKHTGESI